MSRFHLALSALVFSTSLISSAVHAEERAARPAPSAPAPAAPLRVLAAGADASGDEVILIAGDGAGQGPRVYGVQNGKLMTLPILAIARDGHEFVVDTLRAGAIRFDTVKGTAMIRGQAGFNSASPTRTFRQPLPRPLVLRALAHAGRQPKPTADASSAAPDPRMARARSAMPAVRQAPRAGSRPAVRTAARRAH